MNIKLICVSFIKVIFKCVCVNNGMFFNSFNVGNWNKIMVMVLININLVINWVVFVILEWIIICGNEDLIWL